jgi:hypothetical protein
MAIIPSIMARFVRLHDGVDSACAEIGKLDGSSAALLKAAVFAWIARTIPSMTTLRESAEDWP